MGNSFGFRRDHAMPFTRWAEIMGIDLWELFSAHRVNCLQDNFKSGCGVSWVEYPHQVKNRPSRMILAERLFQAETMIGNYLKSPVAPTYVHGEMHTVHFKRKKFNRYAGYHNGYTRSYPMNEITVTTNYRNVLKTGTQVLTRIGETLPQSRTFNEVRGWGFEEDITYCIGSESNPLYCTNMLQSGIDNLCNLRIYQPGYGPLPNDYPMVNAGDPSCFYDECGTELNLGTENLVCHAESWTSQQPQFRHGHRIRPFMAYYTGSRLCIQINKLHNFKLDLYSKWPRTSKPAGIEDLDACDDDNFPERMEVYNVSYEKPDGIAYLRKQPCACKSGCDVCDLREVPICLEPIDPVSGEFRVIPIIDTSDPNDPTECCWEATDWDQCCYDFYGDITACGCDVPIIVCINYMASYCGNWDDCCIPDAVCPELEAAIAYLTAGLFVETCECGCLNDIFSHYNMDMMMFLASQRSGATIYESEAGLKLFGSSRGAYEAYNHIKFLSRVKPVGDYMIG